MDADRTLQALLRSLAEVAHSGSLAEACAAVLEAAVVLPGVSGAWIQRADVEGAPRVPQSLRVPPACIEAALRALPWPASPGAPSAAGIVVVEAAAGASGELPAALLAAGARTATFVPILAGGRLLGALALLGPAPGACTDDERRAAQGLAALAAGVLVRDRELVARLRLERELMAARRLENVGHLAGGVAHDFNNMLTAMIGYMDLVAAGLPAGAEEQAYLAQALDAAEQATDLTRQMLAFARRQPGPPTPQDLGALVDRLAPLARRLMPESVSLVAPHRADPVWVRADAGQLEQVVVMLALRARDAMPGGGVLTLSAVDVECEEDARACVALQAVDTGAGPDLEALRRALEPAEAPGEDGRDLRLAGVAALVRASGGRIEADRDASGSTRIRAVWPLGDSPAGKVEAVGGAPRGRETVLFVEDDPATRDLVTAMLSRLGYEVYTAGGADEALLWLGDHPGSPQLLLADLVLPGMSGRELALRAREARPGMRVLLTSGYAASPGATEVAGGLPFLPKPFTRDLLARRVRETLDAPPAGAGDASG